MKYWEIVADKLHAAGWSWGYCSAVTRDGWHWIVAARRGPKGARANDRRDTTKRAQELAAAEDKAKALAVVSQTPAPERSISTGAARLQGTMLDQPASSGRSSGTMLDRPAWKHWSIIGRVLSKNEDGIIVYCDSYNIGLARPEAGTVVFVAGEYPNLADEDRVDLTCVETGDTYRYTAVSGAAKTVRAFREAR